MQFTLQNCRSRTRMVLRSRRLEDEDEKWSNLGFFTSSWEDDDDVTKLLNVFEEEEDRVMKLPAEGEAHVGKDDWRLLLAASISLNWMEGLVRSSYTISVALVLLLMLLMLVMVA